MKPIFALLVGLWLAFPTISQNPLEGAKPFIHPFEKVDSKTLKSFIKEQTADKRIVGLGEVSHYTKECYSLKQQIIEQLIKEGFDGLVLEVDFGQALIWNDYVSKGIGNLDTIVAASGWFTYRTEEYKALLRSIRQHNLSADKPFHIFGMEMTTVNHNIHWLKQLIRQTSGPSSTLLKLLDKERQQIAFQSYNSEQRIDYWNLYAETAKYLQEQEDAIKKQSGEATYAIAQRIGEIFRQFATYISQDDFSLKSEFRDQFSARNVYWSLQWLDFSSGIAGSLQEESQLAIWAHNGHVAKESVLSNYDVLGHYMQQWFGEDYYAIGFTFNEGEFGSFSQEGFRKWSMPRADTLSLTKAFDELESDFLLLDIRNNLSTEQSPDNPLRQSQLIRTDIAEYHAEGRSEYMRINLSKTYDALIYIDKTQYPTTIQWIR
ncbi:MAG: erythromycin esterase family protein [Bacteroidota bacterium]